MAILKATLRGFFLGLVLLFASGSVSWALDGGNNWRSLGPREKENILRNYQRWQNLPPRDKEHLKEEWHRWQNLPEERRNQLRRRYNELQPQGHKKR
jgi:hypothetical protein